MGVKAVARRRVATLLHETRHQVNSLTHEEEMDREACEKDLYHFTRRFWPTVQGRLLTEGYLLQVICEHVEALHHLQIRNLLFNFPFRLGKTTIISIMTPAWVWTDNANLRFLCNTYSKKLSEEMSDKCRQVISSPLYQRYWGHKVILRKDWNRQDSFKTTAGGWREARSVETGNTGSGGDYSILDDANDVQDMYSEKIQKRTNDFFDNVLSTRLEDPETHRRLVTQQRIGLRDLSGHILEKNLPGWVHVCLPMEYEPGRHCVTIPLKSTNGKRWEDWRKEAGELIFPERFNRKGVDDLKAEMNYNQQVISAQFQQNPLPTEFGRLRDHWFQRWNQDYYPRFLYTIQSWDTALVSTADAAHSSCTTWGVFEDGNSTRHIMLLSLYADQINYPTLRKMALRLSYNWDDMYKELPLSNVRPRRPEHVLIEKKVSGYCLFDDLFAGGIPVMEFSPNKYGKKEERLNKVSDLVENQQVWLPCTPGTQNLLPFARDLLDAALLFPHNRRGSATNDIIDSMSQAFIMLKAHQWVQFYHNDLSAYLTSTLEHPHGQSSHSITTG